MPGGGAPFRLGDIGRQGWNVLRGDLPFPLAVLKESAVAHNGAWMMDFLRRAGGVRIAPHGKTTMSPQLFARQLADGAWGITVATVQQLQVCRSEEHTSELQSLMRISYAVFCLKKKTIRHPLTTPSHPQLNTENNTLT